MHSAQDQPHHKPSLKLLVAVFIYDSLQSNEGERPRLNSEDEKKNRLKKHDCKSKTEPWVLDQTGKMVE